MLYRANAPGRFRLFAYVGCAPNELRYSEQPKVPAPRYEGQFSRRGVGETRGEYSRHQAMILLTTGCSGRRTAATEPELSTSRAVPSMRAP